MTSSTPSRPSARSAPRAVIDTNVWVSGLINPHGAPGQVLAAVRQGLIVAVASWDLADEVVAVLTRPKLTERYDIVVEDLTELLTLFAPLLPNVEVDVAIRDPDDAPVVAAAVAGGARLIVTGDQDLFAAPVRAWLALRGVEVVSPATVLQRLGCG